MIKFFIDLYRLILNFLFDVNDHHRRLGLFRIVLGLVLLYLAILRSFNLDFYNTNSMIPNSDSLLLFPEYYRPYLNLIFWSDRWVVFVHLIHLALLFLLIIGRSHFVLMLLTWVIGQGFIQRNYAVLFGADVISNLFLFYLCFTDCQSKYVVFPVFFRLNRINFSFLNSFRNDLSRIFFRLMQLQIMIIYAYTGFEKLKGNSWWEGTALWTVLVNPQFSWIDFSFLKSVPAVFALGTFIAIVFEVYFPVMVAFKKTRKWWLLLGFLFHLQIGFLLGLFSFSWVMCSTYILFFDKTCFDFIEKKMSIFNRSNSQSKV